MATCTVSVTPLMTGSCDGPRVWEHCIHHQQGPAMKSTLHRDTFSSPKTKQHLYSTKRSSSSLPDLTLVDTDDSSSSFSRVDDDSTRTSEQQHQLQWMLSQLTRQELETAARASYEYLQHGTSADTVSYASRIALRYLQSKKGNVKLALKKLKSTLQFRQDVDIDGLRRAFDSPTNSKNYKELELFLSSGLHYVRCYDKEGRSTHVFTARNTATHDPVWTLKETYYTLERAIACSKAPDQSVNLICDFKGSNPLVQAPPISLAKEWVIKLRQHYAGQIHKIFVLDAPATFGFLYNLLRPLFGKATQDKIVFVSSSKNKEKVFRQYYDAEQSTTWMCPETGCQTRDWNVHEYLHETPFDQVFDEY